MGVAFCERDAVSPVFCVPVFSGSTASRPKTTPTFSSPSFLATLALSPSFPSFRNLIFLDGESGARLVGLLWMGNWHVCQVAVETILLGGTL
ncbi:hypothetical protein SLEP1_g40603 [Rubroshorea leprosula]|uniref:Uncharacterized protein n=1 Tax=Rubroshorea leprosula TaxID=152421 RepID=A0AAV5L428_9ROSI|nr:hypothetical protein SLEP1_g40603 [Rubroshorea leprosula]